MYVITISSDIKILGMFHKYFHMISKHKNRHEQTK